MLANCKVGISPYGKVFLSEVRLSLGVLVSLAFNFMVAANFRSWFGRQLKFHAFTCGCLRSTYQFECSRVVSVLLCRQLS